MRHVDASNKGAFGSTFSEAESSKQGGVGEADDVSLWLASLVKQYRSTAIPQYRSIEVLGQLFLFM